jgi:hypothetical protein
MAQRVFFLNTLRDGVDPKEYEDWVRRVDYPVARSQPAVERYVVTRLDGMLFGEGKPPYHYLEVIEIVGLEEYRKGMSDNPQLDELFKEFQEYVEDAIMVYGEVI